MCAKSSERLKVEKLKLFVIEIHVHSRTSYLKL